MEGFHYFLFGFAGFIALCGALIGVMRLRTILRGRTAIARVVAVEQTSSVRTGSKLTPVLAPVMEFEHEGRTVRFRSSLGQKFAPPMGTELRIRYLPSDPESSAEVDAFAALWVFPLGAMVVAGVFVVAALWDMGYFAR